MALKIVLKDIPTSIIHILQIPIDLNDNNKIRQESKNKGQKTLLST